MKQAIELNINEGNNYDFSNEAFEEMNKYNDFLLDKSLAKFSKNNLSITQSSNPTNSSGKSRGAGGCPFLNRSTFRDIETVILPHYEMKNLIFYPYDFFFDLINYKTKDLVNKSKKIRNIPKFIRNTLFLNDDTIKRVRKMNFNQSFIIGEQLKESTEKIYKEGNYYEALQQYNLIYSLFRWLEFKDKTKEETLMKDVTKISDMPIIDDDVILKRCAVNDPERRRKTNIMNEIKNNGTIDDSISNYSDEDDNKNDNNDKDKDEDEKSNISDNMENKHGDDDDEEESSEGEEEEDDEEEDEKSKGEDDVKEEKKVNKGIKIENKIQKEIIKNNIIEKEIKISPNIKEKPKNKIKEKEVKKEEKKEIKKEVKKEVKKEEKKEEKRLSNKNISKPKEIKKEKIKQEEEKKNEEKKNDDEDEMEELYKYDLINFNKTMQLLLKRMGYCYIHLCSFSEAIECFNEAFKYVDDECPDFYFRRAQAKIYNKGSELKDLKSALGDLNKALSRKITYHSEILLREHKLVQELIAKKEEQICLIPTKLLNNFRYAMNKIKKNNLNIQDYIINNNDLDVTHYMILKEIKEIYFYSIKQLLKKKDHKQFEQKLIEYDNFLEKFYVYDEYYNFDINNIKIDIYRKLNTQQQVDIELLKNSKTLRQLLDEIKYRKCEEIFDNLQINERMYLQAHRNVMEIQRIERDIKNGDNLDEDNMNYGGLRMFILIWNKFKNNSLFSYISQMMKDNFYFFSVSLIVLSLTILASQINQKDNTLNK